MNDHMNELETGWENVMPGHEGVWNPEVPRFLFRYSSIRMDVF